MASPQSEYFGKECSQGFHIWNKGIEIGGLCVCGKKAFSITARGHIKGANHNVIG